MVKDQRVGRPSFNNVFLSFNSFSTEVDLVKVRVLKKEEIRDADEVHDRKLVHRINRRLSEEEAGFVPLTLIRPWKIQTPIDHGLFLAMSCGYWPATAHETATALKAATPEQIQELFRHIDKIVASCGLSRRNSMSVVCLGSALGGKTGELIPVYEVERGHGLSNQPPQYRKLDLKAPLFPAMMAPVIRKV